MIRTWGLVVVALLVFNVEAMGACVAPAFPLIANQAVEGNLQVTSGTFCRMRFASRGPMYSASIVQRPAHGTVQVGAINSVIYVPRAGYVGGDSLVYALHGATPMGTPAVYTAHMAVTVVAR
jgi:hypothetical protein